MTPKLTEDWLSRQSPDVQAIIRALLGRIEHLERRLGVNPQNSSLPPSTQHPHAKPTPKKAKSKKKRGGQPGHKKHERPLRPTDECDDVQKLKPAECRRCGTKLTGCDPAPLRHQVWELPDIKPHVTEYQRHRLTCAGCGETTCGQLPPGVPRGQAGPRLVALVALLMGCFKQSKRRVALFMEQVLDHPCSPGWVVKLQTQATEALAPAYEELAAQLPAEAVLGIDESPTKEARVKSWLWTFVAGAYTLFALRTTRAATVLDELLTESFAGAVMLGMAARVYFNNTLADPETTLTVIARDSSIMPGFVGGLIIAAVLAAICSTADSQLLVAASAVSHDLVVRQFKWNLSLRTRKILDRIAVVALGLIAIVIAIGEVRSVFSFVLDYGWAGLGAGFGPALIFSLFWRRTSGWGVLAGMIIGVVTAIFWRWQLPEWHRQVYSLVPAIAFSSISIMVVSLLIPTRKAFPDSGP